jgi:hypothetical protein
VNEAMIPVPAIEVGARGAPPSYFNQLELRSLTREHEDSRPALVSPGRF